MADGETADNKTNTSAPNKGWFDSWDSFKAHAKQKLSEGMAMGSMALAYGSAKIKPQESKTETAPTQDPQVASPPPAHPNATSNDGAIKTAADAPATEKPAEDKPMDTPATTPPSAAAPQTPAPAAAPVAPAVANPSDAAAAAPPSGDPSATGDDDSDEDKKHPFMAMIKKFIAMIGSFLAMIFTGAGKMLSSLGNAMGGGSHEDPVPDTTHSKQREADSQGHDTGNQKITGIVAIGDSIANGLNVRGVARDCASVNEITGFINAIDTQKPDAIKGQEVAYSTGLSNSYLNKDIDAQLNAIAKNIKTMERDGAHVTLIGVSNENADLAQYNAALKYIADKTGATFAALPTTAADGIHPASEQALMNSIIAANAEVTTHGPALDTPPARDEGKARGQG